MLIAERQPSDLRGWLECQIRAVLEQSELDDSTYMSFVASLSQHGGEAFRHLPKRFVTAQSEFDDHLRGCVTQHRRAAAHATDSDQAMTLIVQTGAQREQARARRWPVLPFALELANLLDCMVAYLEAPVSSASVAALETSRPRACSAERCSSERSRRSDRCRLI